MAPLLPGSPQQALLPQQQQHRSAPVTPQQHQQPRTPPQQQQLSQTPSPLAPRGRASLHRPRRRCLSPSLVSSSGQQQQQVAPTQLPSRVPGLSNSPSRPPQPLSPAAQRQNDMRDQPASPQRPWGGRRRDRRRVPVPVRAVLPAPPPDLLELQLQPCITLQPFMQPWAGVVGSSAAPAAPYAAPHAPPHAPPADHGPSPPAEGCIEAWICIHQPEAGGPAALYEHSSPMDDASWAALAEPLPLLMTVHDHSFQRQYADVRGEWSNFRVRLSSGFTAFEETTVFPNHVQLLTPPATTPPPAPAAASIASTATSPTTTSPATTTSAPQPAGPASHLARALQYHQPADHHHHHLQLVPHTRAAQGRRARSAPTPRAQQQQHVVLRRCHNARGLGDLVQLLADPTPLAIMAHLANAGRLLSGKPWRTWRCLKDRWGGEALLRLGFTPACVHRLLQHGAAAEYAGVEGQVVAVRHYREPQPLTAAQQRAQLAAQQQLAAAQLEHNLRMLRQLQAAAPEAVWPRTLWAAAVDAAG